MRLINTLVHPDVKNLKEPTTFERKAARAIALQGDEILLIYTKRYDDYTIPGGGVDRDEPIKEALLRELHEETGANNIKILNEFGCYEEYRPYYKETHDQMHMVSYIYVCSVDKELGQAQPESYEINNGSRPVWLPIDQAIEHNRRIIDSKPDSMGLSVQRELEILELVKKELVEKSIF